MHGAGDQGAATQRAVGALEREASAIFFGIVKIIIKLS